MKWASATADAHFCGGELRLQQTLFVFFLASDAVTRPGNCFKTLQLQFLFALCAGSEFIVSDSLQRFVNELQHRPVSIGLPKQEFLGIGVGGLVGEIDGWIVVSSPPFLFGARDAFEQL